MGTEWTSTSIVESRNYELILLQAATIGRSFRVIEVRKARVSSRARKCGAAACGRMRPHAASAACGHFLKKCGRMKKSAASAARFSQKVMKFYRI